MQKHHDESQVAAPQVQNPEAAHKLQWMPDVLGKGFKFTTFNLGIDEDVAHADHDAEPPELVATLVRSLPKPMGWWDRVRGKTREFEDLDVLYVHGWSDYFFQTNLAKFWTDRGARFHALDLRRYGRSLRDGHVPGYITNLADYDTEIDLAIKAIRDPQEGGAPERKLVLLGHSTGGLVLSLWCSRHPGVADALILNSPWLEFQLSSIARQIITPAVNFGAKHLPLDAAPQIDFGFYARAQKEIGPKDELARVDLKWRPDPSHLVHSGWLSAILSGHAEVHEGLGITTPVCVLLSTRSALPTRWSDDLTHADTVLDVNIIAEAALKLGQSVTIERIDGALHDVFLSAAPVRQEAYERLERWTVGWKNAITRSAR